MGRRGEVKEIADGYALNYLIPHGMAKQATSEAEAAHKKQQAADAASAAQKSAALADAVKKLDNTRVVMKLRANEQGHLFKGVGHRDIADAIGHGISPDMIGGDAAIKETGVYKIKITAAGAAATIDLTIEKAD